MNLQTEGPSETCSELFEKQNNLTEKLPFFQSQPIFGNTDCGLGLMETGKMSWYVDYPLWWFNALSLILFYQQIPFSDFTLTNSGTISEEQPVMLREKVRTVGISVLMPNTSAGEVIGDEGLTFDIGIERSVRKQSR